MIRGTRSCARKPIIVEAAERLEASPLASRLIDLPRLKRLIAEWPSDAVAAEARVKEYRYGLDRAVHVGQFIRWVEGGNA
jgi:asparagine synthase (glutamine-hydrolysing)